MSDAVTSAEVLRNFESTKARRAMLKKELEEMAQRFTLTEREYKQACHDVAFFRAEMKKRI